MNKLLIKLLGIVTLALSATVLILFAYQGLNPPRWVIGSPSDFASFSNVISGTIGTLLLAITALFVFETVTELRNSNTALLDSNTSLANSVELQRQALNETRSRKSLEALTDAMGESRLIVDDLSSRIFLGSATTLGLRVRELVSSSPERLSEHESMLRREMVLKTDVTVSINAYLTDLFYSAGVACKYLHEGGQYFLFRMSIDSILGQLQELTHSRDELCKYYPDLSLLTDKEFLPFTVMQNHLETAQDNYLDELLKSIGIVPASDEQQMP